MSRVGFKVLSCRHEADSRYKEEGVLSTRINMCVKDEVRQNNKKIYKVHVFSN